MELVIDPWDRRATARSISVRDVCPLTEQVKCMELQER